jgi:hypothetical protein
MIMQNKLLYVNKRKIIAKILNIPDENINTIRNKQLTPEEKTNITEFNILKEPNLFLNKFEIVKDDMVYIETKYGNRLNEISNIIFNTQDKYLYFYPIIYKNAYGRPDCIETYIRNFINLIIYKNDNIDIKLLPETMYKPVLEYYNKYKSIRQHNNNFAHDDWMYLFNIDLKELIQKKIPHLENKLWSEDPERIGLYNFTDMNGGGILFTIVILIFFYGGYSDTDELFEEIRKIDLEIDNEESKKWVIDSLNKILHIQLPKISETEIKYKITMNGNIDKFYDVLKIYIYNLEFYIHEYHADINIIKDDKDMIHLHHINSILNIAYPNIHKITLLKHLHINKKSINLMDEKLKTILRFNMYGRPFKTLLDPRNSNYTYFKNNFDYENYGLEYDETIYGMPNKIQIMTKMLYTYPNELKYFIENIILSLSHFVNDKSILQEEHIKSIIYFDDFFSQNGFSNYFINRFNILFNAEEHITQTEYEEIEEGISMIKDYRYITFYKSDTYSFLKLAILFRKCITDIHINDELFEALKFIENTVGGKIEISFTKNINKILFIKIFAHYCISDKKFDNFKKFMKILIEINFNNGYFECLINNFWIFYFNNSKPNDSNPDDAKLNKFIFDKFLDIISKINYSNNTIKTLFLFSSVQTEILYNLKNIISPTNIYALSPIFDYGKISSIIRKLIVFNNKLEYFEGKNMVTKITDSILENIDINDTDMINFKLGIIQKEYIEVILENLKNTNITMYNSNKDKIIENISNFLIKLPENKFLIDLHEILEFENPEILTEESKSIRDMILYNIYNYANPNYIKLLFKYPKTNQKYNKISRKLKNNEIRNFDNMEKIISLLNTNKNEYNEYYIDTVIDSIRNEIDNVKYKELLQKFIIIHNKTQNTYTKYVKYLMDNYEPGLHQKPLLDKSDKSDKSDKPIEIDEIDIHQKGGYYKKYLKYKEKYLILLNSIKYN